MRLSYDPAGPQAGAENFIDLVKHGITDSTSCVTMYGTWEADSYRNKRDLEGIEFSNLDGSEVQDFLENCRLLGDQRRCSHFMIVLAHTVDATFHTVLLVIKEEMLS